VRPPEAVSAFVREAVTLGRPEDEIRAALAAAGWSAAEIAAGLAAWARAPGLPPVPRPRGTASPREALAHVVLFVALGVLAVNLWLVGVALIDRFVPDPMDPAGLDPGSGVRWAVAGIAVAWPLWAVLTLRIARAGAADPSRRRSAVGRWVTAVALFIAAVTLVGDLIAVLARFLDGELTARFLAKAVLVAALAGAVFMLYARGLDGEAEA
jgi:hypothetical protein